MIEREVRAGAGIRGLAAVGRQPGPLPPALPRTGAGGCRNAVGPAPARLAVPAVTLPGDRACNSWPGGPPAPGMLTPRKDHNQGRTSSLRCGRSTLILIFHGKNRHLSGGPQGIGGHNHPLGFTFAIRRRFSLSAQARDHVQAQMLRQLLNKAVQLFGTRLDGGFSTHAQ